jgi:hypothetical protein
MSKTQTSKPSHPIEQSMRQACEDSANVKGASGHAAKMDLRYHKELNAAEPEATLDIQSQKPARSESHGHGTQHRD